MQKMLRTYWPGLLAVLFWGLSYNWSTICFKYYSPLTTIFIRLVLSSFILFIYLRVMKRNFRIRREHFLLFLSSAFFTPFIYFIGENYGLDLTTPTTTAVIIATIPLFTPIAAYLMYKERLSKLNIFGILISFAGVLLMIMNPMMHISGSSLGISLLLLAVLSAIAYSLIVRKLTDQYKPITIIAWQNLIGMVYFLPFFLFFDGKAFTKVALTNELVFSLLALAVFASSLAFILFVRVLKEIGISKTNVLSNLIPLVTALTAFYLGQEFFSLQKVAGMGIALIGVFLSQKPGSRKAEGASTLLQH